MVSIQARMGRKSQTKQAPKSPYDLVCLDAKYPKLADVEILSLNLRATAVAIPNVEPNKKSLIV